jgi:2-dehydropantoate 2-reductase
MKILVYGVGAIGSLMVHYLCTAGNEVTIVARSTYEELKENGLIIEHYLQNKKTTIDHPKVVKEADLYEKYDMVISVMQGQQQLSLLETFSKLNTELIVLVGNNWECEKCESYIKEQKTSKRVLFGFQNSAGHREGAKAVVGRLPTTELIVGGLHTAANPEDLKLLQEAFHTKGYKITAIDDMYGYYMYHIAEIMPYAYICYKYDYDLKKVTSNDIKMVMQATNECFNYLKSNNIKVMPPKEDEYYDGGIKKFMMSSLYRIMSKTVLGKLMVSDHCKNGIKEIKYLDDKFDDYRKNHPGTSMPKWDALRQYYTGKL